MTKILELLKNEKVEWKKLKDVLLSINTGLNPRKNFILNDSSGNLTSWYITTKDYSQTEKIEFIEGKTAKITEEARQIINKRSKLEKGDLLFSAVGTVGKIALVEIETNNFDVNESTFVLKPNYNIINNKYLMYYLRCNIFQNTLKSNLKGSTLSGVRKGDLENFEIPVPPLEIQEKIVKILDKFTNYVTELQSELQSRTKQYTYYRDELLSEEYLTKVTKEMEEDGRLNIVTLGEIGKFTRGNGLQKKDFLDEGNPVIHYGQIYTKYGFVADEVLSYVSNEIFSKLRKAQKNDILIATTSENVEDVGKSVVWLGDEEIGFSGDMYSYRTEQNSKYIAYYFQTNAFQKQKERKATGTKMIRIHADDMEKFEIPLPPLSLQNKIVKVLDKFQVLLADTKGLLPEEIEQRQKQYEYYREKLLTFDVECSRTNERTFIISNIYYDILQEAANIVEVDIEDKIELKKLLNITKKVDNINWKVMDRELYYIDLSSVNTGNKKIEATELITKTNAPSRAKQIVKSKDIIFGTTRPMQERLALIPDWLDNQICSTGYCVLRGDKEIVKEKWIYYNLLKTDFYKYVELNQKGASYPAISDSEIKNYKIPIPPLHVQQYVVSILDKFDTLVNDIRVGLPKEIEQRQQQYEYWRECLLNFPR